MPVHRHPAQELPACQPAQQRAASAAIPWAWGQRRARRQTLPDVDHADDVFDHFAVGCVLVCAQHGIDTACGVHAGFRAEAPIQIFVDCCAARVALEDVGIQAREPVFLFHQPCILRSVCARRARWPVLPGLWAAASSFLAGMVSPFFTPRVLRRAPGFLIASAIHLRAAIFRSYRMVIVRLVVPSPAVTLGRIFATAASKCLMLLIAPMPEKLSAAPAISLSVVQFVPSLLPSSTIVPVTAPSAPTTWMLRRPAPSGVPIPTSPFPMTYVSWKHVPGVGALRIGVRIAMLKQCSSSARQEARQ